jgi:hypothetical protein
MALFMVVHTTGSGPTAADQAAAHCGHAGEQGWSGVSHLRYWVSESGGKVFCLIEADDMDLARSFHLHSPGLTAEEIHPVSEHARPQPRYGREGLHRPSTKGCT